MITPIPFEKRRFRTAAHHYLSGRSAYAPELIGRVVDLCDVAPSDRVMDLGCGPGMLARAFAPYVAEVVGIDPEPEMLRIAGEQTIETPNVRWIEGSSYDLSPAFGTFKLVVMGRSFHWMDRIETLRRLDGMIVPGGAVALFHVSHPAIPQNGWRARYDAVLHPYAEQDPTRVAHSGANWVRHEGVLIDSAFSHIETMSVMERRHVPLQRLIDRALSMSTTSRAKIGDQADEMVEKLRAALPAEGVEEVTASSALLAWRPGQAP